MRKSSPDTPVVALARVTKPVGLNGGVRVQLLCDRPERLEEVQQLYRGKAPESKSPVVLREVSVRGNGVVVFFEDCETRSAAEALRGHYLFIDEGESSPSSEDKPRVHDLIGCDVVTRSGSKLGTISNVYDLPAYRMIGVRSEASGSEVLVPYVDAWIAAFDRDARRVVLESDELFKDE